MSESNNLELKLNKQKLIHDNFDLLNKYNLINPRDCAALIWEACNISDKGYYLPWNKFRNEFKLIPGEMTIISGYSGHGKSQLVGQLTLHAISQGACAFFSSFELSIGTILKRLCSQATGITHPSYEYIMEFGKFYEHKLWDYDVMGHADVDTVIESCEKCFELCGGNFFVFDNLMMLNELVDDYSRQHAIVQKLLTFAKNNNVVVILVAHSKKPFKGMPIPGMYEVSGSSNIINMVDNHISITKNLKKINALEKIKNNLLLTEDEEEGMKYGDAFIHRDKKREFGSNFLKSLYFNEKWNVFTESENEKPINYLYNKRNL